MKKQSSWSILPAMFLLLSAMLGCNFVNRWREQKPVAPRRCFNQSTTTATVSNNNTATPDQTAARNTGEESGTPPEGYLLINSTDGGFSVRFPNHFPAPDPPKPIRQGQEYAGISYYSFLEGCRCRVNYTDISAMGVSGQSDERVLADRRAFVSEDQKPPATIEQEENASLQGHPGLSIQVSGVGANGRPEYSRYKFVVARGRVYELQFASQDKAELEYPEVNAYFDSFQLTGELDARVTYKPEPEPRLSPLAQSRATVTVRVTVSPEGRVIDAHAINGPIDLRYAAEKAARNTLFAPAKETVTGTISIEFNGPKRR